jgi:hypothetical protein
MKYIKLINISLFFLLVTSLTAQTSSVGNWFFYNGINPLSKNVTFQNEVQYRNYNFAGDLQQLLLRTALGYNLTENNNNASMGYAYIKSANYIAGATDKTTTNEHRIFQQFLTKQNFGRFYIQHRYRIEERWLPGVFKMRFRYFLGLNIPLNTKTMTDHTIYLSAYNEIFSNAVSPAFDRDRLYGGVGYAITKKLKVEFGYMSQKLDGKQRPQTVLTVINSIPFYSDNVPK